MESYHPLLVRVFMVSRHGATPSKKGYGLSVVCLFTSLMMAMPIDGVATKYFLNLVPRCSFRSLHKPLETAEPNYFSRVQTRDFVYTLRMNILD
jgi:hypothetical protein